MEVIKNYGDEELLQAIRDDINMDAAIRYLYRDYFHWSGRHARRLRRTVWRCRT